MAKPRRSTRPQTSPVLLISLAAGVIALIAGGSWYYLNQVQATPVAQAPVATPRPSPVPTPLPSATASASPDAASPAPSGAPVVAATPPALATPAPTTAPTVPATPSPRPTATPKAVTAQVASPLDNGPVTDARSLMRKGSFGPAAKGFATNVKAATTSPFTVQLLVACSSDTVQKALDRVSADDLYILPVSYKGKNCHRICWGLYREDAAAEAAISGLPDYFKQNGATPKVVKTTTLLR
jgi:septal ring-binding cell division protein DamX